MGQVAQVTLYKSRTFGRNGKPVLLGILELGDQHLITIADIEIFPGCQAEVFLELHAQTSKGAEVYRGKLEVVKQKDPGDPNLAGVIKINKSDFFCSLWVSPEILKTKSLKLTFVEIVKPQQPLRPLRKGRHRLVRPQASV